VSEKGVVMSGGGEGTGPSVGPVGCRMNTALLSCCPSD